MKKLTVDDIMLPREGEEDMDVRRPPMLDMRAAMDQRSYHRGRARGRAIGQFEADVQAARNALGRAVLGAPDPSGQVLSRRVLKIAASLDRALKIFDAELAALTKREW